MATDVSIQQWSRNKSALTICRVENRATKEAYAMCVKAQRMSFVTTLKKVELIQD